MMNSIVKVLVGSAIGVVFVYITGKIMFRAGYDMAEVENRYSRLIEETEKLETKLGDDVPKIPEKKKLFGTKLPVIGKLIKNPEGHQANISIENGELKINVRPK